MAKDIPFRSLPGSELENLPDCHRANGLVHCICRLLKELVRGAGNLDVLERNGWIGIAGSMPCCG